MKWKSLFAAALTAAVAWPALAQSSTGGGTPAEGGGLQQAPGTAPGRVISVNFGGGQSGVSPYAIPANTAYGLVSATNWNNTTAATGEAIALNTSTGTASGATLTYEANGTWNDEAASTDPFLQYFLGDNLEGGTTITVANVPFETYDVIVYVNSDTANTSFLPVSINNTKYIGDPETGATEVTKDANKTFGETRAAAPQYGLNAIRVNGITDATLNILGSRQQTIDNVTRRCNIAGFQIVESLPLSISVNIKGRNHEGAAPDSIFSDGDAFSGLVPAQNKNWSEIDTPDGTARTVSVEQAIDSTGEATTATVTVNVGGGWHLRGIGGAEARKERLGLMGIGYADAYTSADTPEVVLADIPYTEYSVILYYATDNKNMKWAPAKVTAGDNKTYYYYYGEDGTLKSDGTYTSTWGSSDDCIAAATTGTLGKDTMRIDDLSGDVSIDLDTSSNTNNTRGGLSGLQIVCTGKVIVPPPPTINVNFASGRVGENTSYDRALTGATTYGLEPVPGSEWKNLYRGDRNQSVALTVYNGETDVVPTVTYNASGMWSYEDIEGINDLLVAALDDVSALSGTSNNTTITVSDVPFTQYDVIVYLQAKGNGGGFKPVEVNGYYYSWQNGATQAVTDSSDTYAWGTLSQPQPALGVNALRISGQTACELIINAPVRTGDANTSKRCNLTGFQIVCTGEVIEDFLDPAKKGVISLNFNSETHNSAVPATETTYGLVAVPGSKWQNLTGTSDADGVPISRALNTELSGTPTVTFSSNGGYQYDADQATCPYLRGYLDDGGNGVSVDVANVPYGAYDAVVYLGGDLSGRPFNPVQVNDTYYTWDETLRTTAPTAETTDYFGDGNVATAAYGTNALRVKALDGALAIRTLPRQDVGDKVCRGGLAAVQLVERKVIEVAGTGFDLAGALARYARDTPVLITFAEGATVTGDVTLPDDAVVDLTAYTFGKTAPFGGALAVNAGTEIRLPGNAVSYTLASSITGTPGFIMQDGTYITDGVTTSDGAITRPVTYEWTGAGTDTNWTTAANWSSGMVPDENAAVTVTLAADDAKTITLNTTAKARLFYISAPQTGSAKLTIATAEGVEGAKLTVSGQMLTTGNVTVTQSADITVNGTTETYSPGVGYPEQPCQAGFHVHQGTWKILSGTLSVPTDGGTNDGGTNDGGANTGEAGISGNGTLIVGGEGASDAKLAVRQIRTVYYNKDTGLANGTLRVETGGTLTASDSVQLPGQSYTTELAGGTIETPTLITFAGATVSADSSLRAPTGRTATVRTQSRTNDALTGTGGVTLSGTVTIESALMGYTGTLTVSAGSALTLSDNARPSLVLVSGATEAKTSLTVTPTIDEAGSSTIVFPTSMTEVPTGVKYTVSGLTEEQAETLSVSVNEDKLTLSWGADYPTLSTSGDWSTGSWKTSAGTTNAPSEGSAILDGTQAAITVTLDTNLSEMTSIFVKGKVTLETTGTQATIPACVALAEGATLTIDANFSGLSSSNKWTLPDGTTLQVTKGFDSFANLTLKGAVVIPGASGTTESPTEIKAPNVEFNGGLTIAASNLTLTSVYNVGKTLELAGNNITIEGNDFFTDNGTEVVNVGTDNVITGMTGLNGSLAVKGGTLALTLGASPTNTFSGATIAEDATLTLAGPDNAQGWWFPVTGAGTLVLEGAIRPMFAAVETAGAPLPKTMVFTATAEEQAAGVISCLNYQNSATLPEGLTVTVYPAEGGGAWAPTAVLDQDGNSYLRIYNQLPTNLPVGVEDAIADVIQQDATTAGITKGYTVQLRTKGGQTTIASPDAATLNDVLGCFTGLKATANAERTTLTYAYDFGIVGIKRNAGDNGWVVTAKVQGVNAAPAGFAEGNAYRLSVTTAGETGSVRNVPVQTVDETAAENGTVELTLPDSTLEGVGDGFTLGVEVSRTAPEL